MSDSQIPFESTVFAVAHPDDFQLFMNPNVALSMLLSPKPVVFIITTAGDAGTPSSLGYWQARELGCVKSLQWILSCNSNNPLPFGSSMKSGTFNGHLVNYWESANTSPKCHCYFLRLPDGANPNNSLAALYNGTQPDNPYPGYPAITTLGAVDNSATYNGWMDLVNTLQSIIGFHASSNNFLNYQQPDSSVNPYDHIDHYATGRAISMMPNISTLAAVQFLYVDYNIIDFQPGGTGDPYVPLQVPLCYYTMGMTAVYDAVVFDQGCQNLPSDKLFNTIAEDESSPNGYPVYVNWSSAENQYATSPAASSPPFDLSTLRRDVIAKTGSTPGPSRRRHC